MPVIRKNAADIKDRIWVLPVVYTLYKVLNRGSERNEQYVEVTKFLADNNRPGLLPWRKIFPNYSIIEATDNAGKPIDVRKYLKGAQVVLSHAYWTCNCDSQYIRFQRQAVCKRCGQHREDDTRRLKYLDAFFK